MFIQISLNLKTIYDLNIIIIIINQMKKTHHMFCIWRK